ncbi:unnamed protein product [Phytomonas sp. EM1]|nr:unnamed protein product [Phytomonas sp. EM1]|eukprot:CCW65377.1 unnamed protein product [Phytomonas sp. isolate EM1]
METANSSRLAKSVTTTEHDGEGAPTTLGGTETFNQCEQGGSEADTKFDINAQAYLESSVMDILTQGLEDLCRMRPANPIDYLAFYLLRRSPSSNVVEVPYSDTKPQVQTAPPPRV